MITGKKGIALIEEFEGFSPKMCKDAVGQPTIGYGKLYRDHSRTMAQNGHN